MSTTSNLHPNQPNSNINAFFAELGKLNDLARAILDGPDNASRLFQLYHATQDAPNELRKIIVSFDFEAELEKFCPQFSQARQEFYGGAE
ncbi:MAG: hypothetical protein KJ077_12435 [Anaerolineae bacterium]|nr:hypothetical protein [Anaerolineae bacterium]